MHRALAIDFFVRFLHHQFFHPRSFICALYIRDLLSAIRGTGSGGHDLALGYSLFAQETSDASIEVSRLLCDVGREVRRSRAISAEISLCNSCCCRMRSNSLRSLIRQAAPSNVPSTEGTGETVAEIWRFSPAGVA